MDIADIIKLKFPNAQPLIDYVIQDDSDGNGPYIAEWNIDAPKPQQKDLDTWAIELQDAYDLQQVLLARQAAYPPKEDLIVALWERVVEGRTDATDELQAKREQVKADNPKPDEAITE